MRRRSAAPSSRPGAGAPPPCHLETGRGGRAWRRGQRPGFRGQARRRVADGGASRSVPGVELQGFAQPLGLPAAQFPRALAGRRAAASTRGLYDGLLACTSSWRCRRVALWGWGQLWVHRPVASWTPSRLFCVIRTVLPRAGTTPSRSIANTSALCSFPAPSRMEFSRTSISTSSVATALSTLCWSERCNGRATARGRSAVGGRRLVV